MTTSIVVAVVVGYLIFGSSAVLLFKLSGHDSHATASPGFIVFSLLYGVLFAFAGGYVEDRRAA